MKLKFLIGLLAITFSACSAPTPPPFTTRAVTVTTNGALTGNDTNFFHVNQARMTSELSAGYVSAVTVVSGGSAVTTVTSNGIVVALTITGNGGGSNSTPVRAGTNTTVALVNGTNVISADVSHAEVASVWNQFTNATANYALLSGGNTWSGVQNFNNSLLIGSYITISSGGSIVWGTAGSSVLFSTGAVNVNNAAGGINSAGVHYGSGALMSGIPGPAISWQTTNTIDFGLVGGTNALFIIRGSSTNAILLQ